MGKYENVKAWRHRTKHRLVEAFGSQCCICRKIYDDTVYDFHHIEPESKKFALSVSSATSWSTIVEEAKKCIMLCANCHRLVHALKVVLPEDIIRFNEDYKYEIKNSHCKVCGELIEDYRTVCSKQCAAKVVPYFSWQEVDFFKLYIKFGGNLQSIADYLFLSHSTVWKKWQKEKKNFVCSICGNVKDYYAKYCSVPCANKAKRKVDWDNIDILDILSTTNFNFVQAGKLLGISDNAVRKRYKKILNK